MRTLYILINICILIVISAATATAGMCGTRTDFIKALKGKYHEAPFAVAMAKRTDGKINVVEFLKSKQGETWTILVTTAEGKTCVLYFGDNWADVVPEPAGLKS